MSLPLNGHAANEPMAISTRTHQVKKPFFAPDATGADFDFTGLVVRGLEQAGLGDVARLSLPNVFFEVNTFPGIRFLPILVIQDTTLTAQNCLIVVDASVLDQDITITLPPTQATGQFYWIIRRDATTHNVQVEVDDLDTETMNDTDTFKAIERQKTVVLMDAQVGYWKLDEFGLGGTTNVAITNIENFFTTINNFVSIRLGRKIVSSDYDVQLTDTVIFVLGATGTVNINLPAADPPEGFTRFLHVVKLDDNDEIVAINAFAGDTIEGVISVNLGEQYANASFYEAQLGLWSQVGFAPDDAAGAPDFGDNFRIRDLNPIHGVAFEVRDVDNVTWNEQVRYTEPGGGPTPPPALMWWYRPEITDDAALAAWPTAGYALNSRIDVIYSSGLRSYILLAGAADPGDPGQVNPDDYDVGTNDVHLEQKA